MSPLRPMRGKARVFLTRKYPPADFEELAGICDLRVHPREGPPRRGEYLRALRGAHVLISMVSDPLDAPRMDAAPSLRLIANHGVGFDNVDLPAATARGILVTNTPGVVAEPTADCAMALLLAVARRVVESDNYIRGGRWRVWTPTLLNGVSLGGKTLGIVGLGGIGSAVARRALGFGIKVRYWSRRRRTPREEAALGVRYRPFPRLLAEADFLSIHVALTPDTRHLLDAGALGRMKRGAVLINTARGAVVDEAALVRALRSGHLGGAGLDVFESEPHPRAALLRMPNVVLMPHLGTSTHEGRIAMSRVVIRNVKAFLAGRRPPNLLNPEAWPHRKR